MQEKHTHRHTYTDSKWKQREGPLICIGLPWLPMASHGFPASHFSGSGDLDDGPSGRPTSPALPGSDDADEKETTKPDLEAAGRWPGGRRDMNHMKG